MSSVKIKDKYTYRYWREVTEPSSVGIVPVKLLEYRYLYKNKRIIVNWDTKRQKINIHTGIEEKSINQVEWVLCLLNCWYLGLFLRIKKIINWEMWVV